MRAKRWISGVLAVALLAGVISVGREAGRRAARAGWGVPKAETVSRTGQSDFSRTRPERAQEPVDPEEAARVLDRLRRLARGSAYMPEDWDVLMEVRRIIAGLPPGMLAELGMKDFSFHGPDRDIMREIREEWMKADPDGAAAALLARGEAGERAVGMALVGWAGESPGEAFAWLDGATLPGDPEAAEALRARLRVQGLYMIVNRNFELASREFRKLPVSDGERGGRTSVMDVWSMQALGDPAERQRLIDFAKSTGVPGDHAKMNETFLRNWKQEDAMGMLTYLHELRDYLESSPAGAEKQAEVDATAVGAAIYREYDRPALEWWMERYSDRAEVPGPLQSAMIAWQGKYPDAVDQWFAEQPESPQKDGMRAVLVPDFAQRDPRKAAELVGQISDPGIRQSAIERLDYIWSRKDAAAAAEWKAGLSR